MGSWCGWIWCCWGDGLELGLFLCEGGLWRGEVYRWRVGMMDMMNCLVLEVVDVGCEG